MKQTPKEDHDLLYESLLQLNNVEECRRFMEDLCTVTELKAMRQRIEVAMYLREGMIYQDILKHTGASSATISRVNRCLQYGADGYQTVFAAAGPHLGGEEKAVSHWNETYDALAGCYDDMTEDVNYPGWADFLEKLFSRGKHPVHTVLDLACGTGTMSFLLAARGYELIGGGLLSGDVGDCRRENIGRGRRTAYFSLPTNGKAGPLWDGGCLCLSAGQCKPYNPAGKIAQGI